MGPPLWQSLRPTLMPQSTMEVTTVTLDITAMVDTDQDTMDTPTATAMVTTMDVILARGLLMLNLKLMLMPQSTMVDTMDTPVPMDMVCTTVDTMVDTMDTPMPRVTDARHFGKRSADAEPEADADAAVYYGGYYGHPRAYGYGLYNRGYYGGYYGYPYATGYGYARH